MRQFILHRLVDESGVSGTGYIAEGVEFSDGTCALRWFGKHTSTGVYPTLAVVEAIHGHDGKTVVEFSE